MDAFDRQWIGIHEGQMRAGGRQENQAALTLAVLFGAHDDERLIH